MIAMIARDLEMMRPTYLEMRRERETYLDREAEPDVGRSLLGPWPTSSTR